MAEIKLNARQLEAVEQIDGPLLVLAGPGTGKTQLLSARVARILEKTDTLAENILCLTFTEKGAANMLERLASFIGRDAYEVNISTYHGFGGELIRRYPQYFTTHRLENAIDELGQHEILSQIVDKLSYQNPLKSTSYHLGDLISTISEVKQALLDPDDLHEIARENTDLLETVNPQISKIFESLARMPGRLATAKPYFEQSLALLEPLATASPKVHKFSSLATAASTSLSEALDRAAEGNSTKPLTAWKNSWLAKDASNNFILTGALETKRLAALADVVADYQDQLAALGLYDYDDMISLTIDALVASDEFKFSLQEKYQYILLDEYQDTNAAQARLVELLTDNPVNEGQPNVMAVGDDDQAIYAFQGALYSNMLDFFQRYRDTRLVSLTENYRSQGDILDLASNIASQIENRASESFGGVSKKLIASGEPNQPTIIRQEFLSNVAELDWVASRIQKLIIDNKVKPSQIAVLAPRHRQLEPLVPFLNQLDIPVHYEKRENILEAPVVHQLVSMCRLVAALATGNEQLAASYWPEVLSYEFWPFQLADIWEISWQTGSIWTKKLLTSPKFRWVALFFMQLAAASNTAPLEQILDYLTGSETLTISDNKVKTATSPIKSYYTSAEIELARPDIFYQTISHLTVLRQTLRERQASADKTLKLADLLSLVELYIASSTRMINTSPYNQAAESVQLMTVFKAKGLEYEHVFLLGCQDEVWGEKARGNSNKLTLPANLAPIRRAGASEDERLRILFVAITRAKLGLYMTSYRQSYSGRATTRLKYLDEREQGDGSFLALALPSKYQSVKTSASEVPALASLETSWQDRHAQALAETNLKSLLAERLANYQLSPTHLNTFIDMERGGPRAFLLNTLLRFPQAPSASGSFGNAVHNTLEWYQLQINSGKKPSERAALDYFETSMKSYRLAASETELLIERGRHALANYLQEASYKAGDKSEIPFKNEGVFVGDAHMSGKIDKLEIDEPNKRLVIVDYKTGKPSDKWTSELKFHKYKQQLYIYKMLIEGSASYRGYAVASCRLEFVEPDASGQIHALELKFDQTEFEQTKALVEAMWRKVVQLELPDTSGYTKDLAGTRQFEADLLAGKI